MLSQPLRGLMARDKMVTATPQATVLEVAGLMLAHGTGAVMVVEDGALVGILSERDVVVRVVAPGRDARTVRVGEVMTPHPVSVDPDVTFGHALLLMHEHGIRHLPAVENGKPIGMVTARVALDPELEEFVCEVRRRETFR